MAIKKQLSVLLPNKPAQLAKITGKLAKAKVNISAISVVDSVDHGVVRIVVDSASKAKKALGKEFSNLVEGSVLALELPNNPGELHKVARKLSQAKVNIDYIYGSAAKTGQNAIVIIKVDNPTKVQKLLK